MGVRRIEGREQLVFLVDTSWLGICSIYFVQNLLHQGIIGTKEIAFHHLN